MAMVTYSITGPDGKLYSIDGPEGASKEDVVSAIMGRMSQQPTQPAPEAESGDFMRGLKSYFPSIQETFGGAETLIGKGLGIESLKQAGISNIQAAEAKQKALGKESDSLSAAWDKGGLGTVMTDWLPYQMGAGVGNILETVEIGRAHV